MNGLGWRFMDKSQQPSSKLRLAPVAVPELDDLRVLLIQKSYARLRRVLERQGLSVEIAPDDAAADRKARSECCDLVVLDLALPGIDVPALVKDWRLGGMNTPIVILASRRNLKYKVEVLDAGADVLITEPCRPAQLLAQIRALHRRTRPSRNPLHNIFDLEIDPFAHMVKRAGRTIDLTRSEFDLLLYLANERGKVVSRDTIWQHVYRGAGEITSNVIDVRVHSLRAKIDKGFELPLILTRRGRGYMLRGPDPSIPPWQQGPRGGA